MRLPEAEDAFRLPGLVVQETPQSFWEEVVSRFKSAAGRGLWQTKPTVLSSVLVIPRWRCSLLITVHPQSVGKSRVRAIVYTGRATDNIGAEAIDMLKKEVSERSSILESCYRTTAQGEAR